MRLRDLGAGTSLAENGTRGQREERRDGEVSRGTGLKRLVLLGTKETELYLEAQEQLGKDLSRGGTEWDFRFTSSIKKEKGEDGWEQDKTKAEDQVGG